MAKREYPKILTASLRAAAYGDDPLGKLKEKYRELVWNQTEYNSFIAHHQNRYHIKEKRPKWKELKGYNFFSRIYYLFPVGITYGIGTLLGFCLGHADFFIEYGTKLIRLISSK